MSKPKRKTVTETGNKGCQVTGSQRRLSLALARMIGAGIITREQALVVLADDILLRDFPELIAAQTRQLNECCK